MDTMAVADVLANYRDGDEHGWPTEFSILYGAHSAHLANLRQSIRNGGIRRPILLGDDGRVWDGHHRLCVAVELGMESVPIKHAVAPKGTPS